MTNSAILDGRTLARERRRIKACLIRAYDDPVIRAYCYMRFWVMNMRIMEEIEQYLPPSGCILDVGCGFGLFSIFLSMISPSRRVEAFDLSARRIGIAEHVSRKLGVEKQIEFHVGDALGYRYPRRVNAIMVLDLIHHLPEELVPEVLCCLYQALDKGGVLLVKEITAQPRLKMAFTWFLDMLMTKGSPVHYYTKGEMMALLQAQGFKVAFHRMHDILPYPHILYICRKAF
jgi:ubiquinone/menaquinone biosynthesis C-methylase UbiE